MWHRLIDVVILDDVQTIKKNNTSLLFPIPYALNL